MFKRIKKLPFSNKQNKLWGHAHIHTRVRAHEHTDMQSDRECTRARHIQNRGMSSDVMRVSTLLDGVLWWTNTR